MKRLRNIDMKFNQDAVNQHLSKEISKIYDVLISPTQRLDEIERYLCEKCHQEKKEVVSD